MKTKDIVIRLTVPEGLYCMEIRDGETVNGICSHFCSGTCNVFGKIEGKIIDIQTKSWAFIKSKACDGGIE